MTTMICNHQHILDNLVTRRRRVFVALACLFTMTACKASPMNATFNIVTFNYCNRPIFDIFINGVGGDSSTAYPATGGSTLVGVVLRLGPQKVTWRLDGKKGMPRNGETVTAKNTPELANIAPDLKFLGVHIYPDETVELIATRNYPDETAKGKAMAAAVVGR